MAAQGMPLPPDLVEGTAAGLHGAGVALLEHLYQLFTGKKWVHAIPLPLSSFAQLLLANFKTAC
jgi:hypothetical protein